MNKLFLLLTTLSVIKSYQPTVQLVEEQVILDVFENRSTAIPYVRPLTDHRDTVNVTVGLILFQIVDVDEVYQNVALIMCFYMTWKDETISWNKSEYNGIDYIRIPKEYVWYPDIHLYNRANSKFDAPFETTIGITNTGTMDYMPPAIGRSTCQINIVKFPFDEQTCWLRYASWTYQKDKLRLHVDDNSTYHQLWFENGEWILKDWLAHEQNKYYKCCPDQPWSEITFVLVLKRRPLFYAVNVLMPTMAITFLSLLSFLLPPESGEKVELESIPHTSESVPLIGVYFCSIMFLISTSIMVTIFVLRLHHQACNMRPIKPWMRKVFLQWLPRLLLFNQLEAEQHRKHSEFQECLMIMPGKLIKGLGNLRVLSEGKEGAIVNRSVLDDDFEKNGNGIKNQNQSLLRKQTVVENYRNGMESDTSAILVGIHKELRLITGKMKTDEDIQAHLNDWKFVALVLDRFLFIVFAFCVIALTTFLFCSARGLV